MLTSGIVKNFGSFIVGISNVATTSNKKGKVKMNEKMLAEFKNRKGIFAIVHRITKSVDENGETVVTKHEPKGFLAACTGTGDNSVTVYFGYSKCHSLDKFNPTIGKKKAIHMALKNSSKDIELNEVPQSMEADLAYFRRRCVKFYGKSCNGMPAIAISDSLYGLLDIHDELDVEIAETSKD